MLAAGEAKADLGAAATADSGNETALSEIVVSAQRRTQSLQDVPYNITAISGAALQDEGVSSINGLTQVVAGLMNVDEGPATRAANNNFVLRGLRTDSPGGGATGVVYSNLTVSPVSTYYGETPVFFQMPLDDLERVEVLRGPQGTLYGSGSQAGTIRFIPKRPQFDSFSGEVSADGSYTEYASDPNGAVHGVLNIPLADHLALRLVAGEDHQAGFIKAVDRVQLGPDGTPVPSVPGNLTSGFVLGPVQKGVNTSDQNFARIALRWQPADAVDLQFDYLHQHTAMADSQWGSAWSGGTFDSSFGAWPLAKVDTRPGCNFCTTNWLGEPFSGKVDLMDVVGTVDVGLGTIT
jgi:outer membrane receptor protein involved in Fe transport